MKRNVLSAFTASKLTMLKRLVMIAIIIMTAAAKSDAQYPGLCGQQWFNCGSGTQLYSCNPPAPPYNGGDTYDGYYIEWRFNGNLISGASGSSYYATQQGSYEVRYVYKFHYFSFGRRDYTSWYYSWNNIYEYALSTPYISASQSQVCPGSGTTLYSNYGNTAWRDQNGIQVGGGGSFGTPALNSNTTYYAYQVNGACSSNPASYTIGVLPKPDATITAASTTICQGSSVLLSAPAGNMNYQWYRNGGMIASGGSNTYTATQAGTYSLSVTSYNNCYNTSTSAITLTVNTAPVAAIVPPAATTICSGDSVLLKSSGSFSEYQWSNGATTSSINAKEAASYTLTVKDANGCSATSTPVAIAVNPAPVVTATSNSPVDVRTSLNLSASGATSYVWSGPASFASTNATPSISNIQLPAAGNYTVTGTDANGCSAKATTAVVVNNIIAGPVNINTGILMWLDASDIDADNDATNDPATNSALNTWKDRSGMNNNATKLAGQNSTNYVTNQVNGKSVVHFTRVNDAVGSAMQATGVDIRANANPKVTIFTVYKSGTHDASGQGQAIFGNDDGTWDRFMYNSWAGTNDGIASLGPLNPSFVNLTGAGTPGALRLLTAVYDGAISGGINNGPVNGSAIYFNGAVAATFTDQTHATAAQPTLRIGLDGDNGAYNGDIAEMIVYNRKLTDCEILQINQYLGAKYGVTFTSATIAAGGTTTLCQGANVVLTASTGASYKWYNNGTLIPGATSSTYTATNSGSYTVDITSAAGCTATSVATMVTVNALPVVTASSNSPVTAGSTLNLTATGATSYAWTGPNGFVSGTPASRSNVTAAAAGTYTVTGTDINNCKATATTAVVINTPAGALNFEKAKGNLITVQNNVSIPKGNDNYTIEAWIKPSTLNTGAHAIAAWGNWGATDQVNAFRLNGTSTLINYWWGHDLIVNVPNLADGNWHHVAATFDGTTRKIYTDGILRAFDTPTGHNVPAGSEVLIGSANPVFGAGEFFDGSMDEVRIWKRALCAEELSAAMNCERNGAQNNLSLYYKFTKGLVNADNTQISNPFTADDLSGNGNSGALSESFTLTGATSNWTDGKPNGTCGVFNAPAASIGGWGTPLCIGKTLSLTTTIAGGTWTSSNPAAITVDRNTGVITTVSAGSAVISYTTLCGAVSNSQTIVVNPTPVNPTYTGVTTVCKGGSTTITVLHPDPAATFAWCNNVSTTNTITLTNVQGNASFCVAARVNGCSSAQIPIAITAINLPTFTATKADVTCTSAGDGRITINSSNATAYSIDNGATFVSTNTFTGLTAGTYNVVVKSAAGCNAAMQVITVGTIADVTRPMPTVATLPVLTGQCSVNVTTTPTANDNCSGVLNGTTTDPLIYTAQGTYTITWTYTDASNNITTQTQQVIVKDDTKPVITTPDPIVVTLTSGCSATINVPAVAVTDNCQNPPGSALNFDGVNDQVAVANGLPSMNEMTIETWLNPKRISNWDVIMNYNSFGTGDVHFQFFPDGKLEFSVAGNNPTDQFTSATFTGNQWYHFAAVYSATGKYVKFYLNGNLIDTRTYSTAINTSNGVPFTIGNWANQRPFEGDLDDLRIWNIAKTDVQIKADMNKTLLGSETGLLAYYNFNQGTACAANSSNQTLTDLKGLRNGTLQNFDLSASSCNSNWTNGAPTTGITITNDRTNTNNASGVYPVGNTNITWTATDAAGNISTATQLISVLAPEVNLTGNSVSITNGATTVSAANNTDMGQTFPGIAIVKNYTIENKGTAPLTISSINITGASSFTLNGITLPATIAANSSSTFNLQFLSNTVGIANATVTINNNDCDEAAYNFAVKAEINCTVPVFNNINVYLQQSTAANGCNAVVAYPLSVTGIPAPAVTYVLSGATTKTGAGTGSGETFNKGVTHVIVTAANACAARTAEFDVTVVDDVKPVVKAKNITVPLNANGTVTITPSMIDDGSADNCGPVSLSISNSGTVCGIAGEGGVVTLQAPAGALIDRIDFASYGTPTGTCGSFAFGGCNATNSKTIAEQYFLNRNSNSIGANNGVFGDPCGGIVKNLRIQAHYSIAAAASSTFDCSNVGANTVTLTVTDAAGNVSTQVVTVTVVDNTAPVVVTKNITVTLNASGTATIAANAVDNGSADACGGLTFAVSKSAFDCSNVGANTVTLTVTDKNNNVSTGTAIVTVVDNTAPAVFTQNITVQLDANGVATITPAQVNNGSTDACGGLTFSLSKSTFDCSNVGANTVVLTVRDKNNNVSTRSAVVTVEDHIAPVVITQHITIQLDANGNATITPASIDNGSNDACGGLRYAIDKTNFNCGNTGANTVTLTVTDKNNNSASATAIVTVEDHIAPVVVTKNITISLDAAGNANITASAIDNGSHDACDGLQLSIDKTNFDCSNVGNNKVTLTVTDRNNNTSSATAIVTVIDNTAPVVITRPVTVSLDANGKGSLTAEQVDNGSNDACGIRSVELSKTDFTCADFGTNTVTLTVTDIHGNVSTATAVVTVEDHVAPVVVTRPVTISLDANGNGSITAAQINNGSTDNCSIRSVEVSKTNFDCSNYGENTVTLTVTDIHGNISTATAVVTVEDHVAPVVVTRPVTVSLDANGKGSITAAQVDNGSNDACGIRSVEVSKSNFDCSNSGENTVTLTVTDIHGNVSTATAVVTVEDHVAPVVVTKPVTVSLDANGNGSITAAQINNGSTDNCGIASVEVSKSTFDCSNFGVNTVTLTVTDIHGNVSTATAVVTVEDQAAPVVVTRPVTVSLDANGNGAITAAQINNGSTDNCGIASVEVSKSTFDCSNFGANTVTLTVTDIHGNVSTATAVVTVEDQAAPVVVTRPVTVSLDANGNGAITAAQINNGSTDNCGIASVEVSKSTFDCSNFGANTVTLTVTDIHGNVSTATAVVTVEDHVAPVISCPSAQVFCANTGGNTNYTIPALTASDNCGVQSSSYTVTFNNGVVRNGNGNNASGSFSIGTSTITWTVTDIHGNISSCSTTVKVNPLPVASISASNADAYCNKLNLTGSSTLSGPFTYQWNQGATTYAATQQISLGLTEADGVYSLYTTDANGCRSEVAATYTYNKQNTISNYTIYALKNVKLGYRNQVNGSVGVLDAKGKIEVKKYSSVLAPAFVKAATVTVDNTAIVTNKVIGVATITLPTMQLFSGNYNGLPNSNINTNTTLNGNYKDVKIKKGSVVTVTGSLFKSIEIEEGAVVTFTSTVLNIEDLHIDGGPSTGYTYVNFSNDASIRIAKQVKIDERVRFNEGGKKVTIFLGDVKADEEKFMVKGRDSRITANIYVPNGKIQVEGGCYSDDNDHDCDDKHHQYGYHDHDSKENCQPTIMTGIFIGESVESNGKNVIWNGYNCGGNNAMTRTVSPAIVSASTPTATETLSLKVDKGVPGTFNVLKATVRPNPTTTTFVVRAETSSKENIVIRIVDAMGRVQEMKQNVSANTDVIMGGALKAGAYFIEVMQGNNKQSVKAIKMN